MGSIYDIIWDEGVSISALPSILLVRFDDYIGPDFIPGSPGIVPIFLATRQFEYKGVACARTQFPLQLAFAITVHKAQGLTLPKVVIDLNQRAHSLGLLYVAVSRVTALIGLLFKGPFDFKHFMGLDSVIAQEHELD